MVRPHTYGWPGHIQRGVKPPVVRQWVRRERVSLEGSVITHVSYPGSHSQTWAIGNRFKTCPSDSVCKRRN